MSDSKTKLRTKQSPSEYREKLKMLRSGIKEWPTRSMTPEEKKDFSPKFKLVIHDKKPGQTYYYGKWTSFKYGHFFSNGTVLTSLFGMTHDKEYKVNILTLYCGLYRFGEYSDLQAVIPANVKVKKYAKCPDVVSKGFDFEKKYGSTFVKKYGSEMQKEQNGATSIGDSKGKMEITFISENDNEIIMEYYLDNPEDWGLIVIQKGLKVPLRDNMQQYLNKAVMWLGTAGNYIGTNVSKGYDKAKNWLNSLV